MNDLKKCQLFFDLIGLQHKQVKKIRSSHKHSFWAKTRITKGVLEYTEDCHVGHLLHEAGHISVLPTEVRCALSGDLLSLSRFAEFFADSDYRYIYADEYAAIAWSYFAALAADVDSTLPFVVGFESELIGLDVHQSIKASIGTLMGSAYSVRLYYAQMLDAKGGQTLTKWMQD